MEKEYKIGNHTFPDEVEYQKAKKDYEYIERFQKELDLSQPDLAQSLYERLRKSKYLMKTTLGEAFMEKLVQIFIQQQVREKKLRLLDVQEQSFKDFFETTLSNPYMRWYWRWFEIAQCSFILGSFAALYAAAHVTAGMEKWRYLLRQACVVTSIFSHVLIWLMILVSLLLLGGFFAQRLQRKSINGHCIHLTVMSGALLCIELLFLK